MSPMPFRSESAGGDIFQIAISWKQLKRVEPLGLERVLLKAITKLHKDFGRKLSRAYLADSFGLMKNQEYTPLDPNIIGSLLNTSP